MQTMFDGLKNRLASFWGIPFEVMEVNTWCAECGARHSMEARRAQHGEDTMLHQEWCSVDMRSIRRSMVVRR